MKIFKTVKDYRLYKKGVSCVVHGFVPTMGCLHDGHISLVKKAKETCDIVTVSIFVNPSQFAPNEDLDKYPRTMARDIEMLKSVGADALFVPSVQEMYPNGITTEVSRQTGTFVTVHGLSHQLEGGPRPHHFRGVATVVTKLFNAVQPDKAFFGQKDVQQCVVLRNMTTDLLFPIDIHVVETTREQDGLAMSSRNRYLNAEERTVAPILFKALSLSKQSFLSEKLDRKDILEPGLQILSKENRISIDYFNLSDPFTLEEVDKVDAKRGAILSGTIRLGKTRLLDNLLLGFTF